MKELSYRSLAVSPFLGHVTLDIVGEKKPLLVVISKAIDGE